MASMWAHSLKELTRFQAPEQERHPDALELIVGERRARSEVGAKHVKGAHRGPKALPCPARCQGRAGCLSSDRREHHEDPRHLDPSSVTRAAWA